jgi:DNA ligase-1
MNRKRMVCVQFSKLYKQNDDRSIQSWQIEVEYQDPKSSAICKRFGRVDGKIQSTSEIISSGKNIGRANETTPYTQAISEAKSQWEKKLKEGYSLSVEEAELGNVVSKYVAGGHEPMLAHKWKDHSDKISYPAWTQPKLDGIRCIAIIDNGTCSLWSRTRKPIVSIPHIQRELEKQFNSSKRIILDGELYNHELKDEFEKIVSLVRRKEILSDSSKIQYHVYDVIEPVSNSLFSQRLEWMKNESAKFGSNIKLVSTDQVANVEQVIENFSKYRKLGYEGAMCRADSLYESGRSYGLQKIKEFDDSEYEIVGVEAGRGRMSECAIFVCTTKTGEFRCKKEGSLDELKQYLSTPNNVIGKKLTVRYQGLTNAGLPRFPVGIGIRDYE